MLKAMPRRTHNLSNGLADIQIKVLAVGIIARFQRYLGLMENWGDRQVVVRAKTTFPHTSKRTLLAGIASRVMEFYLSDMQFHWSWWRSMRRPRT